MFTATSRKLRESQWRTFWGSVFGFLSGDGANSRSGRSIGRLQLKLSKQMGVLARAGFRSMNPVSAAQWHGEVGWTL